MAFSKLIIGKSQVFSARSYVYLHSYMQRLDPPPCHVFAYNRANTCTSVLTFPNYELEKGQYAFYPIELSRFGKNK